MTYTCYITSTIIWYGMPICRHSYTVKFYLVDQNGVEYLAAVGAYPSWAWLAAPPRAVCYVGAARSRARRRTDGVARLCGTTAPVFLAAAEFTACLCGVSSLNFGLNGKCPFFRCCRRGPGGCALSVRKHGRLPLPARQQQGGEPGAHTLPCSMPVLPCLRASPPAGMLVPAVHS